MIRPRTCGRGRLRACTLAALLFFPMTSSLPAAAAQQRSAGTVTVSGVISDPSAGVLPDAAVDAIAAGRVVATTTTGGDGQYRLELPAGVPVELRVRRSGFADAVVALRGGDADARRDVTLQVGGLADTLVVTASAVPESRTRVTEAVSVLTAADVEALGSASLADVMRVVPGIAVEAAGRDGAQTSVFARGGESDYNLVLIDGVRVNQSGGLFDFSRIAASEIERVEVVRGAQSALYGSDAMGAVVQVFTRRSAAGDGARVSGSVEAGSFDTWRGDARVTGRAGSRVDYHAGLAGRRTDGAFADRLLEDDRFEQVVVDGGAGVSLGTRASARTGVRYATSDGRLVGPIGYGRGDTGTAYDATDLSWDGDLSHSIGSRYTGTAAVTYYRHEFGASDAVADAPYSIFALLEGTPGAMFPQSPRLVRLLTADEFASLSAGAALGPGQFIASRTGISDFVSPRSASETQFRRPRFRYQGDLAWGAGQRLSAGYEIERESAPLVDGYEQTNHALFVQQQFSAGDRWMADLGVRVDDRSTYDTFVSPKLSLGGYLIPARSGAVSSLKVYGNAGRGIKAPQFFERLGSSFADGNPDLAVERVRSVDAGVELTLLDQRLRAAATWFDNDFRDQIEFRASDPFFRLDGRPDFINIAGADANGWEIEAALQRALAGFTASGSYTLVDSEVTETLNTGAQFRPGQPLLRRPRHSGAVRVGYTAGPVAVHLDTRIVGERHDAAFLSLRTPAGVFTDVTVNPGYAVTGATVDARVHRLLRVFLRGDNITDEDYQGALGFPGAPRAFMVGARVGR